MVSQRYYLGIAALLAALSFVHAHPSSMNTKECLDYCANNGICVIINDAPRCYCMPEWEGERCDSARRLTVDQEEDQSIMRIARPRSPECAYVDDDFCKNGGLCRFDKSSFGCTCKPAFIGFYCELPSREYHVLLNTSLAHTRMPVKFTQNIDKLSAYFRQLYDTVTQTKIYSWGIVFQVEPLQKRTTSWRQQFCGYAFSYF